MSIKLLELKTKTFIVKFDSLSGKKGKRLELPLVVTLIFFGIDVYFA